MMTTVVEEGRTAWDEPFVALYRERYGPMVRLAYLLTGDRSVAEELVQDAFVSVHRSWSRATNPPAYLRVAVVNACLGAPPGRGAGAPAPRLTTPQLGGDEMWDRWELSPGPIDGIVSGPAPTDVVESLIAGANCIFR